MASLKVGDKAPLFKGINQDGKEVSNHSFQGKKLVLFFYPKDGTPGCTAEACNLRDNFSELQKKGYTLLGVSPDSAKKHANFIAKHELPFDLVADTEHTILELFDAWGEKQMYGKTYMGVLRKTYLIDENGVIQKIIAKVNTKNHAEQILEE